MTVQLSNQQDAALMKIRKWYFEREKPYFNLGGYAGTGKTTLCGLLAQELGEGVFFSAYTGKAALQLKKKGAPNASTLHRLLYDSSEKSRNRLEEMQKSYQDLEGDKAFPAAAKSMKLRQLADDILQERRRLRAPSFTPKDKVNSPLISAKLVIVDECSMVDKQVFADLLSYEIPVLFVGDPAQLPPVMSNCPLNASPADVVLTEVHRQALDNPILRAATLVRQGKWDLSSCVDGKHFRITNGTLTSEDFVGHDQILVGRNKTRSQVNNYLAKQLGFPSELELQKDMTLGKGERIIFLKNDHGNEIYNGSIGIVHECWYDAVADELTLDADIDGRRMTGISAWPGLLRGDDPLDAPRQGQSIDRAYGMTVHKAQGSEWDSVLVKDESGQFSDQQSWLYTAITRARTRCTLAR